MTKCQVTECLMALCRRPFHIGSVPVRCMQCMACRVYRRRVWIGRMIVESMAHQVSSFVTLTYAPSHYPRDGSLSKAEFQAFLKALRHVSGPFRYVAIGEYGPKTLRAHYHACIFGQCHSQEALSETWGKGFVSVRPFDIQAAQYVGNYTTKLMDNTDLRTSDLVPQFMTCSLKPGIGVPGLSFVENALYTQAGAEYLATHGDVMSVIRVGRRTYPLGRYLTCKLRARMGIPSSPEQRVFEVLMEEEQYLKCPDLLEERRKKREAQSQALEGRRSIERAKRSL